MKKANHQKYIQILMIIITLGTFSGCKKETPPAPAAPEVTVARPVKKNVRPYYDMSGNTEAVKSVDILARVEGFLEEIHFEDGDDVKAGDVLFTIEQDAYKAKVEQAQAMLQSAIAERQRAEADLKRVEKAVVSGAVSEQEVDLKLAERNVAVAAVAQVKAALKQAELQLSYTEVTTPVSGRVSRSYVDVGNLVGSGGKTLLTHVVEFDPMDVYFNISELFLSQFLKKSGETDQERREANATMLVGLADEEGFPHEGTINFIDNRLDETTGTVQARGTVPNQNRLLYPGMFVRIRIPSLKETEALLVHEEAIGTDLGGKFLLLVDENNVVERRYVKLGLLYDNMRVIEEGLEETDHYIFKGIQRARPGLPVTVKKESES